MQTFKSAMEVVGTTVDGVGVLLVVAGALLATGRFLYRVAQHEATPYRLYRQDLGRAILLGLEFLVAGDIIRTVVVAPTLENVITLGGIVLIRTFLSFSLELELEGRWPWQGRADLPTASRPPGEDAQPGENAPVDLSSAPVSPRPGPQ